MMPNAITGVTGMGAISTMNNPNRLRKHFILVCLVFWVKAEGNGLWGIVLLAYMLPISSLNHSGLLTTIYMPIKQPGEIGPKPIMANTVNTARHLNWVRFINVREPAKFDYYTLQSQCHSWAKRRLGLRLWKMFTGIYALRGYIRTPNFINRLQKDGY